MGRFELILNNFKTLKNECLQIVEVSLTCYTCAEHLNHINKRILIHNTEIYQPTQANNTKMSWM